MHSGGEVQSEIINHKSEIPPSAVRAGACWSFRVSSGTGGCGRWGGCRSGCSRLWLDGLPSSPPVPAGGNLQDRRIRRGLPTYRQAAERFLPPEPVRSEAKTRSFFRPKRRSPLNPVRDSIQTLILSVPYAVFQSEQFVNELGFMNFSRWVVLGAFLGFVLPLFTLSYATAAFGTDRESRSLVWLMTRPIPRSGIYLAKFLGTLPWCLLFGLGGFVALCLAGGEFGRRALALYWPAAALATVAFAALFHLIGAIFRRPVVVGLVYVFFFEALVGSLPGSLKLLSLTFYARCLMYNAAEAAGLPGRDARGVRRRFPRRPRGRSSRPQRSALRAWECGCSLGRSTATTCEVVQCPRPPPILRSRRSTATAGRLPTPPAAHAPARPARSRSAARPARAAPASRRRSASYSAGRCSTRRGSIT